MSGDVVASEVVVYGFMFLNMATVVVGLLWAWRRRAMFAKQDGEIPGLGPEIPAQETRNV
ncbi:MAG: hypothetical protein HZB56_08645 [Deltaproteobacteria bacterium]|nr:hypothetical protein [Deltaproteobacteria bacterium]